MKESVNTLFRNYFLESSLGKRGGCHRISAPKSLKTESQLEILECAIKITRIIKIYGFARVGDSSASLFLKDFVDRSPGWSRFFSDPKTFKPRSTAFGREGVIQQKLVREGVISGASSNYFIDTKN